MEAYAVPQARFSADILVKIVVAVLLAGVTSKLVRIAISNSPKLGNTDEQNSYRKLDLFHLLVRLARVAKQALIMGIGAAGLATAAIVSGLVVEAERSKPFKAKSFRNATSNGGQVQAKRTLFRARARPKASTLTRSAGFFTQTGNIRLRRQNKKRNVDNAALLPATIMMISTS